MHVLGIDPALTGAIVLCSVQGGALRADLALYWRKHKDRRFVLHTATSTPSTSATHGSSVYQQITHVAYAALVKVEAHLLALPTPAQAPLVVFERPFMGRGRSTSVQIALNAGRIVAPFEASYTNDTAPSYPAVEWRKSVLGCKGSTKRDEAKVLSLALVPESVPGLTAILLTLAANGAGSDLDDVSDAAGLAMHHAKVKGLLR